MNKADPIQDTSRKDAFETINRACGAVFKPDALTLGLVPPLAAYPTQAEPPLDRHIERIQLAEALGFSAIWLGDGPNKPVMQSLYIDLVDDPDAPPSPIHLGFRSGTTFLRGYLHELQRIGVNHVALNLRFNHADIEHTMRRLADDLLPDFQL